MTRNTFSILLIMIVDIILLIICDIFCFEKGTEYLSIIVPIILVLIGFSCFNNKCYDFWNKKIRFKK